MIKHNLIRKTFRRGIVGFLTIEGYPDNYKLCKGVKGTVLAEGTADDVIRALTEILLVVKYRAELESPQLDESLMDKLKDTIQEQQQPHAH